MRKSPRNPFILADVQPNPEQSLTATELLEEIDDYNSILKSTHCALHRVITENDFSLFVTKTKDEIRSTKETYTLIECFYFLQRIAAFVCDGHTKIQSPDSWAPEIFPAEVTLCENRLFVTSIIGKPGLPLGSEIIRVGQYPISVIINQTMEYIEGTLDRYKEERWADCFSVFLQTKFNLKSPWVVEYTHNGVKTSTKIDGVSQESSEYKTWFRERVLPSKGTLRLNGSNLPILRLPHLGFDKETFWKILGDFFEESANEPYILIDVRRCPGGNGERGFEVIDRIMDCDKSEGYTPVSSSVFRVSESYKKYVSYQIGSLYYDKRIPQILQKLPLYRWFMRDSIYSQIYHKALQAKIGDFVTINWPLRKSVGERNINGRLILLIAPETFSAGVVFAASFKHATSGIVIGRETGGRISMLSDSLSIQLPRTGLFAHIPTCTLTMPGDNPDRGVLPDVSTIYTPEDYVNLNDKEMEQVSIIINETVS